MSGDDDLSEIAETVDTIQRLLTALPDLAAELTAVVGTLRKFSEMSPEVLGNPERSPALACAFVIESVVEDIGAALGAEPPRRGGDS